jgi:hypothetical protein
MMHDWYCSPLWWTGGSPEKLGLIEEGELPIQPDLWERLVKWVNEMDATSSDPDPREWGMTDPHEYAAWERRGFDLWMELREQLGSGYHITFHYEGQWLQPEDFPLSA